MDYNISPRHQPAPKLAVVVAKQNSHFGICCHTRYDSARNWDAIHIKTFIRQSDFACGTSFISLTQILKKKMAFDNDEENMSKNTNNYILRIVTSNFFF